MNLYNRASFVRSVALVVMLAASGAVVQAGSRSTAEKPTHRPVAVQSNKFMPESDIRYGQTGYALTVFHGTKIERFGVKLLGVLKRVNNGKDLILFRAMTGPSVTRSAMIVAGMSGSPVYVDGKIVGAIAYGLPFAREPIGLITPIRDMLESWDPHLRTQVGIGAAAGRLNNDSVSVDRSMLAPMLAGDSAGSALPSGPMTFEPMMTPIAVSGMSQDGIARLARQLAPYRLMPIAGGGAGRVNLSRAEALRAARNLQPGASVGVSLAQGDLDLTAIGTLTYRDGDRIIAFGHPFTGIGPIDAALTTASITDIFPSYEESTKLGMPIDTVGRIVQDRPFSVGGTIGAKPDMIPVTVSVDDEADLRHTMFHARVIDHPLLTGLLTLTAVNEAITEAHGTPGDAVAYVTTDVNADQIGHIVRRNVFYDPLSIDSSATDDLSRIVEMLSANPFYRINIKSVNVKVRIEEIHATAELDHIVVPRLTYQPGDTVNVGVVLRPFKEDPVVRTISLKIPESTPDGTLTLQVRGGAMSDEPRITLDGNGNLSVRESSDFGNGEAPPVTVQQLVKQFLREPKNNDLVATLDLPGSAPEVGGQKLLLLPPTMSALMRSEHASALEVGRDEVKSVSPQPWVVSGVQQLTIDVRAKQNYDISTVGPTGTPARAPQMPTPGAESPSPPASGDIDVAPDVAGTGDDPSMNADTVQGAESVGSADRPTGTKLPPMAPPPPSADESISSPDVSVLQTPIPPDLPGGPPSPAASPGAVSRIASIWRENTMQQFAEGTLNGATVTSAPDVRIAPLIEKVAATTASYVWSEAADYEGDEGLFLGTGNDGLIYEQKPGDSAPIVFAHTDQLEVTALAIDPASGVLYAATAPNGIVFRVLPNGKITKWVEVPEPYITALLFDDNDKTIYLATAGGSGRVYAVDLNGEGTSHPPAPRLIFTSPDVHLLCLAQGPDGSLYTGGNPNGVVYKVDPKSPSNTAHVVYDSPGPTVSAVAVDSKDRLYVGTAPSGQIVRVNLAAANDYSAPQIATTLVSHAADFISGLAVDQAGEVWGSAGDTLYRITPGYDRANKARTGLPAGDDQSPDVIASFESDPQVTYTNITAPPSGGIYAGTASIGDVYGYRLSAPAATAKGTFISAIHDSLLKSRWGTIDWNANVPDGASVDIETRTGDVPKPDDTWSDWSTPYADSHGSQIDSPPARFIQYRAIEAARSGDGATDSPRLDSVDIYYMMPNRPPTVKVLAPLGGEDVSGIVALRWLGSDPDLDTLDYRLFTSTNDGVSWKLLDTGSLRQRSAPAAASAAVAVPVPEASPSLESELSSHPEIPASVRRRIVQSMNAAAPIVSTPSSTPGTLRGQTFNWDTRQMPDGVYRLEVVAGDAPSNATGALSAEAVSQPFVVDNTPPVITLAQTPAVDPATGAITEAGTVSSTLVFVKSVQYKVDDGPWMAAAPVGGLFDSTLAQFRFTTGALPSGPHHITVEAFDRAGNSATRKIDTK